MVNCPICGAYAGSGSCPNGCGPIWKSLERVEKERLDFYKFRDECIKKSIEAKKGSDQKRPGKDEDK